MTSDQRHIDGETLEMWLPVMHGANNAMMDAPYTFATRYGEKQVNKATMFDINKTIMRCLTKNLMMFDLVTTSTQGKTLK